MIDFRYHLVSLIAVFLAVALGIIIGTTALNEPLQANIEGQVTELELPRSYHVATLDYDAPVLEAEVVRFVASVVGDATA